MKTRRVHSYLLPGRPARLGGFTLYEVLFAVMILGMGIAGVMMAMGSAADLNGEGIRMTKASFLAQQIREWTLDVPFRDPDTPDNPPGKDGLSPLSFVDDLDDLYVADGLTYSPPVSPPLGDYITGSDSDMAPIYLTNMTGWSQTIVMTWRSPNDPTQTVDPGDSDLIHVQVTISENGEDLLTTGWLIREND
jgi:hypothetical protein